MQPTGAAPSFLLLIIATAAIFMTRTAAELVAEERPHPMVAGFTAVVGVCSRSQGTIPNEIYTGKDGTLKSCAARCRALTNCVGFNFADNQNLCILYSEECESPSTSNGTANGYHYYVKGEFLCKIPHDGEEYRTAFTSNRADQPKDTPLEMWFTQYRTPDTSIDVKIEASPSAWQQLDVTPSSTIQVPFKKVAKSTIPSAWRMPETDHGVVIAKQGLKLSSSAKFVLYGVNKEYFTADAFLGLPTIALGSEYVVACHWLPRYACELAVTPIADGTIVNITLPADGQARNVGVWPAGYVDNKTSTCNTVFRGRNYAGGKTLSFELNEFDVAQLMDSCDLTGAVIKANKPIAVFAGNDRTNIGISPNRDHLVEQFFPIEAWGTDCAGWPTPFRQPGLVDYWVLTAAYDNTRIRVDSSEVATRYYTLNARESVRFLSNSVNEWKFFSSQSDKPFQAVHFAHSTPGDNKFPGDPAMTICVPTFQFAFGYSFVTPQASSATQYTSYATVIVSQGKETGIQLDDAPLRNVTWKAIPNSNLVGGQFQLDTSKQAFRISHKARGAQFSLYVYGAGDRESYAYPAGSCCNTLLCTGATKMVIADLKDNDCDGVIDEEVCGDKVDNDLDGDIDEDCYINKPCNCCSAICPDIPQIARGYTIAKNVYAGSSVTYKCLRGGQLVGQETIFCTNEGRWSGPAPTCQ